MFFVSLLTRIFSIEGQNMLCETPKHVSIEMILSEENRDNLLS